MNVTQIGAIAQEDMQAQQFFEEHKKKLYSGVLAEECAEVIVALSKIDRFGINSKNPDGKTNRESLIHELGDVLAMISLLAEIPYYGISADKLEVAKQKKLEKMNYWLYNPVHRAD